MSQQLTEDQATVLDAVECLQPAASAQIAAHIGRPRSLVYQQLVKLQAAGWVTAEKEGRSVRYLLTSGAVPLNVPNPGRVASVWAYAQGVAA